MIPPIKLSRKTVLAGLMLASAVLVVLPARYTRWISRAVQPLLAPLGRAGMELAGGIRAQTAELLGTGARDRDADLVALALSQQLTTQESTIEALRGWRSYFDRRAFPCQLIDANVVGAEPLPTRARRLLDAGTRDGLAAGDLATTRRLVHEMDVALPERLAVLGRNYLVGRIVEPGAYTATLQLVTDPRFSMPGYLWRMVEPGSQRTFYVDTPGAGRVLQTFRHDGRTGRYPVGEHIPVLAEGDGRRIVCRHVKGDHGLTAGDMLTTAISPELLLPFGLPIGRVVAVEPDRQDAHAVTVFVEPLADLPALRQVYVVMPVGRGGER